MDESEKFIRDNIPSLLAHHVVKSKTGEIGGAWRLHEISASPSMPRNIEFSAVSVNDLQRCLHVGGAIRRDTAKFSKIEVNEI